MDHVQDNSRIGFAFLLLTAISNGMTFLIENASYVTVPLGAISAILAARYYWLAGNNIRRNNKNKNNG